MLPCFLAAKLSIVCLVTLPGVKQVECIEVGEHQLCVDTHYDTACIQEAAFDWDDRFGSNSNNKENIIVSMLDTINLECKEDKT